MHARVVRFTGVTSEQVASIASRVENEGPPTGVEATGAELFFDESQGTAIIVRYFESQEKLQAADSVFDQMR